jgi:hypothetical protein
MKLKEKLFKLRQEIKPFRKEKQGYNYKYFDINQMIEQLQPLLVKHKLILTQPLTSGFGNQMAIKTRIDDVESDEFIESTVPLIDLQDAQKMGGCITYFRRYSLQSLLFLEAEDNDANETKPDPSEVEDLQNSNYKPKF